jgi:hypothetical protein
MSFSNVGSVWSPKALREYLSNIEPPAWKAVCLHHTAAPSLKQRPKGFTVQHIINIRDFYKEKGWKSGPHFFTDEDQIFGMTPVTETGVHAVSFNRNSLGIEVLGDYDSEDPKSGRGLECWETAAKTTRVLLDWLKLTPSFKTVLFHRDDPKTSKSCPGTKVEKDWVLSMIRGTNPDVTKVKKHEEETPKQMVVAAEYLKDVKGYSAADITKLLKKDAEGLFFFGDDWLEQAYYDAKLEATVAPISELVDVKAKAKTSITSYK